MIKTKFFQTCIGLSMVLLSLGFFIHSIQTATASPNPGKFLQSGGGNIGKYMITFASRANDGVMEAIVWNTETAKNEVWYMLQNGTWEKLKTSLAVTPF